MSDFDSNRLQSSLGSLRNRPLFEPEKPSWGDNISDFLAQSALSTIDSVLLGVPGIIDRRDGTADVFGKKLSELSSGGKVGRVVGETAGFLTGLGVVGKATSIGARTLFKTGLKEGLGEASKGLGKRTIDDLIEDGAKITAKKGSTFGDILSETIKKDESVKSALTPFTVQKEITDQSKIAFQSTIREGMFKRLAKAGVDTSTDAVKNEVDSITTEFAERLRKHGPFQDTLEQIFNKSAIGQTGLRANLIGYASQAGAMTVNMGIYNNLTAALQGKYDEDISYDPISTTASILPISLVAPVIQALPGGRSAPLWRDGIATLQKVFGVKSNYRGMKKNTLQSLLKLYTHADPSFGTRSFGNGSLRGAIKNMTKDDMVKVLDDYVPNIKSDLLKSFLSEAGKDIKGSAFRMAIDGIYFNAVAFGDPKAFMNLSKEEQMSHILTGALLAKRRVKLNLGESVQHRYDENGFVERVKLLEYLGLSPKEIKNQARYTRGLHRTYDHASVLEEVESANEAINIIKKYELSEEERGKRAYDSTYSSSYPEVKAIHDSFFRPHKLKNNASNDVVSNEVNTSAGLEYMTPEELRAMSEELKQVKLSDGTRVSDGNYMDLIMDVQKVKSESIESSYLQFVRDVSEELDIKITEDSTGKLKIQKVIIPDGQDFGRLTKYNDVVDTLVNNGVLEYEPGTEGTISAHSLFFKSSSDDMPIRDVDSISKSIDESESALRDELVGNNKAMKMWLGNFDVSGKGDGNHYMQEIIDNSRFKIAKKIAQMLDGDNVGDDQAQREMQELHGRLLSLFTSDGSTLMADFRKTITTEEGQEARLLDDETSDNIKFMEFLYSQFAIGRKSTTEGTEPMSPLDISEFNNLANKAKRLLAGSKEFALALATNTTDYDIQSGRAGSVSDFLEQYRLMKMFGNNPVSYSAIRSIDTFIDAEIFSRDIVNNKPGISILSESALRKRLMNENPALKKDRERLDELVRQYKDAVASMGFAQGRMKEVNDFTLETGDGNSLMTAENALNEVSKISSRFYERQVETLFNSIKDEFRETLTERYPSLGSSLSSIYKKVDELTDGSVRYNELGLQTKEVIDELDSILSEKLSDDARGILTSLKEGLESIEAQFETNNALAGTNIKARFNQIMDTAIGKKGVRRDESISSYINRLFESEDKHRSEYADLITGLVYMMKGANRYNQKSRIIMQNLRNELWKNLNDEQRSKIDESELDDFGKSMEIFEMTGDLKVLKNAIGRVYASNMSLVSREHADAIFKLRKEEAEQWLTEAEKNAAKGMSLEQVRVKYFPDMSEDLVKEIEHAFHLEQEFGGDLSAINKMHATLSKHIPDDRFEEFSKKEFPIIALNLLTRVRHKELHLVNEGDSYRMDIAETLMRKGNVRHDFYKEMEDDGLIIFGAKDGIIINGSHSQASLQGDNFHDAVSKTKTFTDSRIDESIKKSARQASKIQKKPNRKIGENKKYIETKVREGVKEDEYIIDRLTKTGVELVDVSESAGFYILKDDLKQDKIIASKFIDWYEKMEESLKDMPQALSNFKEIHSDMIKSARSVSNAESNKSILLRNRKQMLKSMYFSKQNIDGFKKILDVRNLDSDTFRAENAKFFKYIKTSEANSSKAANKDLLKFLAEKVATNKADKEALGHFAKNDIRILSVADESGGAKKLLNVFEMTNKEYDERIANATGKEKEILTEAKNQLINKKDSFFNGATFVGTKFRRASMMLSGNSFGDDTGGFKPVVAHNDFEGSKTVIMKTHFFYDKVLADVMDKMGVDMLTFESATKSYSGNQYDIGDMEIGKDVKGSLANHFTGKDVESFVETVPFESLKIGAGVPESENSVATLSFINFNDPTSIKSYVEMIGLEKDLKDYENNIFKQISSGDDFGGVASALFRTNKDASLNPFYDSVSNNKGFASTMVAMGYPPTSSMLKYEVNELAKNMTFDKLSGKKAKNSIKSVFVPESGLDSPVFLNGEQVQFGQVKLSESAANKIVFKGLSKATMSVRIDGRDIMIKTDDDGKIVDSSDSLALKDLKNKDEKRYKNLEAILRFTANEFGNNISLTDLVRTVNAVGLDVVTNTLRIPRKSPSDVLINRISSDFYKDGEGNVVGTNSYEVATKHQGDFDVDKMFVYNELPFEMMKRNLELSGLVIDAPTLQDKIYTIDLFGLNSGSLDGVTKGKQDFARQRMLLGQIIKTFKGITYLSNFKFRMNGITGDGESGVMEALDILNDKKMLKDLTTKAAIISQSSLDNQKGYSELINDPKIIDYLLFGDKSVFVNKSVTEKAFRELNPDVNFDQPVLKNMDVESPVQKEVVKEVLNTIRNLSRITGDVYDQIGQSNPMTFVQMRGVYNRAEQMLTSPNRTIFSKLLWKFRDDESMKGQIFDYLASVSRNKNETGARLQARYTEDPWRFMGELESFNVLGFDGSDAETRKALLQGTPEGIIGKFVRDSNYLDPNKSAPEDAKLAGALLNKLEDYTDGALLMGRAMTKRGIEDMLSGDRFKAFPQLKDLEKRSIIARELQKRILRAEAEKDSMKEYATVSEITFAVEKIISLRNSLNAIMSPAMREAGFNLGEDGPKTKTISVNPGGYIGSNSNRSEFVYLIPDGLSQDINYTDLEFVGSTSSDKPLQVFKRGTYIKVSNPIRKIKRSDRYDSVEGFSWFLAIEDAHPGRFKEPVDQQEYETILDEIAGLRGRLAEINRDYTGMAKNNPASSVKIYDERTTAVQAEISAFLRRKSENTKDPDNRKFELIKLILQPSYREGEVFSHGGVDVPNFYINGKLIKSIVQHVNNNESPAVQKRLYDMISLAGDYMYRINENRETRKPFLNQDMSSFTANLDRMDGKGVYLEILGGSSMYHADLMVGLENNENIFNYSKKNVLLGLDGDKEKLVQAVIMGSLNTKRKGGSVINAVNNSASSSSNRFRKQNNLDCSTNAL